MNVPQIEIKNISKHFSSGNSIFKFKGTGTLKAVNNVSLQVIPGETLGLNGESGCGKSTIARLIMGLIPATEGEIFYRGEPLNRANRINLHGKLQMVFQDPYTSLDPRMNVRRIVEEPLRIHGRLNRAGRHERSWALMKNLGFKEADMERYPHEFSGGQLQRIGIARAFITDPSVVICDEPVSALDMSIQSQILNLFMELKQERNVTYLFISHDMNVVKHVSNRIAVLYLGSLVELAGKKEFFDNVLHPYSQALISAIPVPNPAFKRKRIILSGEPPNPLKLPSGCPFQNRCDRTLEICRKETPPLNEVCSGHYVACYRYASGGSTPV
jgi:oligopeptide/dipeptide ABC transporter ATP-binding protein